MCTRRILTTLILLLICPVAQAAESFRFGVLPSIALYSVEDPLGPTEQRAGFSPAAVMFIEMGRDSRLMAQLAYDSFTTTASTTNVHNDVTSLNVGLSYQMMMRVTRGWKPWLGVGAAYASEKYENRYTVTSGGFLCATCPYPNRTNDDFLLVLNASSEWQINRDWDMGLHLQFEQPMASDGTRVVRFGLYLVY
jgi:hypothetical protein